MSQRQALSHAEAGCNAIVGLVLAQVVLWGAFDLPFKEAVKLNFAFLVISYARAYVLRRMFARL